MVLIVIFFVDPDNFLSDPVFLQSLILLWIVYFILSYLTKTLFALKLMAFLAPLIYPLFLSYDLWSNRLVISPHTYLLATPFTLAVVIFFYVIYLILRKLSIVVDAGGAP